MAGGAGVNAQTNCHKQFLCLLDGKKERDVSGRCKSAGEVLWRCDDYCAHGLGWERWAREVLSCKIHQKDACMQKKNRYRVGLQFTCIIGRLISDERSRERRGIKFYGLQEWGSEV